MVLVYLVILTKEGTGRAWLTINYLASSFLRQDDISGGGCLQLISYPFLIHPLIKYKNYIVLNLDQNNQLFSQ